MRMAGTIRGKTKESARNPRRRLEKNRRRKDVGKRRERRSCVRKRGKRRRSE